MIILERKQGQRHPILHGCGAQWHCSGGRLGHTGSQARATRANAGLHSLLMCISDGSCTSEAIHIGTFPREELGRKTNTIPLLLGHFISQCTETERLRLLTSVLGVLEAATNAQLPPAYITSMQQGKDYVNVETMPTT